MICFLTSTPAPTVASIDAAAVAARFIRNFNERASLIFNSVLLPAAMLKLPDPAIVPSFIFTFAVPLQLRVRLQSTFDCIVPSAAIATFASPGSEATAAGGSVTLALS